MEVKKSKVKGIIANGTYDGPNGTLYKFQYTFEDGTELSANHKTPAPPFNDGDEVEYTIKGQNTYGSWGNVRKVGSSEFDKNKQSGGTHVGNNPDRDILILFQNQSKIALDMVAMDGWPSTIQADDIGAKCEHIANLTHQLTRLGLMKVEIIKNATK